MTNFSLCSVFLIVNSNYWWECWWVPMWDLITLISPLESAFGRHPSWYFSASRFSKAAKWLWLHCGVAMDFSRIQENKSVIIVFSVLGKMFTVLWRLGRLHLKLFRHERKWKHVLGLCEGGSYLRGKSFMRKVCSPQLGRLGKHREMGRVESPQSYHETRDL